MTRRRALAYLAAPVLLLTACGSGEAEAVDPPASSPSATTEPSSPAATTVDTSASCVSPAGDSTGVLDLTGVEVTASGDDVTITFTYAGEVPTTGSALWSVTVASADEQTARQLGFKVIDGTPSAFVYDMSTATQENLTPASGPAGGTLTQTFAASAGDGLGEGWTWHAVLSVEGTDVDTCVPEALQ